MNYLKKKGLKLACASNSISSTVEIILKQLGILSYFDLVLSNESVNFPKPHPEMYWKAMLEMKVYPDKTVIIEDSPIGRIAANQSGANSMFVQNSKELTDDFFKDILTGKHSEYNNNMYENKKLNILIPMAGRGSRFADKGYVFQNH